MRVEGPVIGLCACNCGTPVREVRYLRADGSLNRLSRPRFLPGHNLDSKTAMARSAKLVPVGPLWRLIEARKVETGMTWRELANWLKKIRWDPESVRELGQDPDILPPRDRQRFWFTAITGAGLDSAAASRECDRFAEVLRSAMTGLALWWLTHPDAQRKTLVQAIIQTTWHGLAGVL